MVIANRRTAVGPKTCPHCSTNFITWDTLEKEPFCFICGWRKSVHISEQQARNHFRTERAFWLNLFASEEDPDEVDKAR